MERMVSPVGKMSLAYDIDYTDNILPLPVFMKLCSTNYHFHP